MGFSHRYGKDVAQIDETDVLGGLVRAFSENVPKSDGGHRYG